jgi:hypothetical protein
MVTYRIEAKTDDLLWRWVVVAVLDNRLSWEVGRYADRHGADERLALIEAMMRADMVST